MKSMKAIVRKHGYKKSVFEGSYLTIKDFRADCIKNGYSVVGKVQVDGGKKK